MTQAPNINWTVENIRMTAFGNFDLGKLSSYFSNTFGKEPDRTQMDRATNQANATAILDKIQIHLGLSTPVSSSKPALQLLLRPMPRPNEFSDLGAWDDVVPRFHDWCSKWLATGPEVTRVAFGSFLNAKSNSKTEAYECMKTLLPNISWDCNARDLIFQINRPRTASSVTAEALEVNRVANWSVVELNLMNIPGIMLPTGPVLGMPVGKVQPVKKQLVLRLALDINTDEKRESLLPTDQLEVLFGEMVSWGEAILKNGDEQVH